MFNSNFYQPNRSYTLEMAISKMLEKGFENFSFIGSSFTNGASFYFRLDDGSQARVSDHPLTGQRNNDYKAVILFIEPKVMINPFSLRNRYLSGEITFKEYKSICNKNGFICKK